MKWKLLITVLFFSFLTFSCSVIQSASNKFQLNEVKLNHAEKNYNKFLIVAGGSAINHIFIDNLTEELIQKLAKRKIKTSYSFLGSSNKEGPPFPMILYIDGLENI